MTARALKTEEYRSTQEPYYAAQGDEIALAEALTDDAEMLAAVNEIGASLF